MNIAGIELRYLVNEIGKVSEGYYVSNIYGITKSSLLFKLHHPDKSDIFMMLSTSGIWTTTKKIDQIEPNRLLRRLRNDLLRAKIIKIEQIDAERIVYLTFNNFDKEFVLVAELFGDGNMVLCSSEMKILALLHSIDVRHRKLTVGLQYSPPPSNSLNICEIKEEQFNEIVTSEIEAVRWVGKKLGFPKKYAEEIFCKADIDPKKRADTLSTDEVKKLFETTNGLVGDIINGRHDAIIVRKPESSEIYPVKVATKEKTETVDSFMDGLDRIFTEDIISEGKEIQSSASNKQIEKYQSQLEEQTKAIETVLQRTQQISSVAKSVMGFAAMGILSIKDQRALDLLKEQNVEMVSLKGITHIKIGDEKIKVDLESSLQAIASALFNESKKQANAVSAIRSQQSKTQKNLERIKSQISNNEEIGFNEIIKRTWFQRYRWFFTSDDMIAIGGRDSSSNSAVIRKHLEKNDKVFHAEIFGSPFFILKNAEHATTSSLNEVAHATGCFSRAWREAMYGISSYWVTPEQIKKAAPSGQFLPKGSFIVDGQRNYVKITTLKLAVGILQYNENYLLTCGSPGPIKKHCMCYAIIEPSSGTLVDAAKKIKFEFTKVHEEITKTIHLDEFVRVLPAGGSHVTELGDGENIGIRT